MKLFWALLLCAAVIMGPSTFTAATQVSANMSHLECEEFKQSVSAETMFTLSVESYQGLWGKGLSLIFKIEDNKVNGWEWLKTIDGEHGFSCTIWQNKFDQYTYAMVLAGTDDVFIEDVVTTYLPMLTFEEPCKQLQQTVSETKHMTKYTPTKRIDRLYISGYSLGGYLSNYLATELVDASNGHPSTIKTTDISSGLTIDNVHCFSYAAPGLYSKILNWPVVNKVVEIPSWAKRKLSYDANGDYEKTIMNFKNTKDPVANLFIGPDNFTQVGSVYSAEVPEPYWTKIPLLEAVVTKGYNLVRIGYHAPDAYYTTLQKIKTENIKPL